jgi:hypothetical protein
MYVHSSVISHILHTIPKLINLLLILSHISMPVTHILNFTQVAFCFMVHCSALKTGKLKLIGLDVLDKKHTHLQNIFHFVVQNISICITINLPIGQIEVGLQPRHNNVLVVGPEDNI